MVIVDQFTKMIRFKATTTTASSKDITKVYWDEIWKLHGVLQKVLSDRGPQFSLKFIEDLMKVLEMKRILLIAYYPQTDRHTE